MNNLTRTDTVESGDLFVIYKTSAGDFRGVPVSGLLTYLQENLSLPTLNYTTQYSSPSANGFNVTLTASSNENVHLILTPTSSVAGTITLPSSAKDKQEVIVNTTQSISALTVAGNGATSVTGEPSSLSANSFFRLKYDAVSSAWYRIG